MPLTYAQGARRVRRSGTVWSGNLPLEVPGLITLRDVADMLGESEALKLLQTGRLEVVGKHYRFHLVYTLEEDKK